MILTRVGLLTLSVLAFALAGGANGTAAPKSLAPTEPVALGDSLALYVVRVLAVSPEKLSGYAACLRERHAPIWRTLRSARLLAEATVFEVDSVVHSDPNVPAWNLVIFLHLEPGVSPTAYVAAEQMAEDSSTTARGCDDRAGVQVRRAEVMRSTPNSYYPTIIPDTYPTIIPDRRWLAGERKVDYLVEYIRVRDTPHDLNEYREIMRTIVGPATGRLTHADLEPGFIALETISVQYSQSGMPNWNQLHINATYPAKEAADDSAFDSLVRQLDPRGGGVEALNARIAEIRTKPREDQVRPLLDLEVR